MSCARSLHILHLAYISPISRLYLAHTFPSERISPQVPPTLKANDPEHRTMLTLSVCVSALPPDKPTTCGGETDHTGYTVRLTASKYPIVLMQSSYVSVCK